MRIIIQCPENILHLEAEYIYADCAFVNFKPLAVWRRTIHNRQLILFAGLLLWQIVLMYLQHKWARSQQQRLLAYGVDQPQRVFFGVPRTDNNP